MTDVAIKQSWQSIADPDLSLGTLSSSFWSWHEEPERELVETDWWTQSSQPSPGIVALHYCILYRWVFEAGVSGRSILHIMGNKVSHESCSIKTLKNSNLTISFFNCAITLSAFSLKAKVTVRCTDRMANRCELWLLQIPLTLLLPSTETQHI